MSEQGQGKLELKPEFNVIGSVDVSNVLANALRAVFEGVGTFSKGWLEAVRTRAQRADINHAQSNQEILRRTSAYIQTLRFSDYGLAYRLRQFTLNQNRRNAGRLREALNNTRSITEERLSSFLEFWNDEKTAAQLKADHPELAKIIDGVRLMKACEISEKLEPQNFPEMLPFSSVEGI
jgi:hypothetical protein